MGTLAYVINIIGDFAVSKREREREADVLGFTYFRTRCAVVDVIAVLNSAVRDTVITMTVRTYVQSPHVTMLYIRRSTSTC